MIAKRAEFEAKSQAEIEFITSKIAEVKQANSTELDQEAKLLAEIAEIEAQIAAEEAAEAASKEHIDAMIKERQ